MTAMRGAGAAWPPAGWIALARREPRLMQRGVSPRPVQLTPGNLRLITDAHDKINTSVRYTPDKPGRDIWGVFGQVRGWLTGRLLMTGDCDDYAAEKMRLLLDAGFGRALRLITCRVAGEHHLVMGVDIIRPNGEADVLILDNREAALWSWDRGPMRSYVWLKRSVPGRFLWEHIAKKAD